MCVYCAVCNMNYYVCGNVDLGTEVFMKVSEGGSAFLYSLFHVSVLKLTVIQYSIC